MRDGFRRRHLYVVLEDWHSGYSIRKVNLPSRSSESTARLPQALLHVAVPTLGSLKYMTPAFGTKIVVLQLGLDVNTPLVDVLERSVTYASGPCTRTCCPIFIPVSDNKLFVMDVHSFESCCWSRTHPSDLSWNLLPDVPFSRRHVSSYAVQPDEAILVSTKDNAWKLHGNWTLPFNGLGHYDPSLEAFVGLSKHDGYIYICSITSSPRIKCCNEQVYTKNLAEKHESATLVYMRRDKFCLVECVSIDAGAGEGQRHYKYRLMTFYLRYDIDGDLKLKHGRVCYYNLPHESTVAHIRQAPQAFWL
ncbi:unnamed protein product [Urochloa decumbens]|uniref:DUF295 domain-containing protein n=1 Tax=Urochloa decumbens TaxID=240449 RepID=A0ABC8YBX2_9POAL